MSKADDALVKAEDIREQSIQDQAMALVPDAMKTLGQFAKGRKVAGIKPTASVTRASARDILEMAGGRPETRDPRIGGGEGNVQIFIQQFGSEEARRLAEGGIVRDVSQAMAGTPDETLLEAEIRSHPVARTFTIPDRED